MKILILGSTGMLGNTIATYFSNTNHEVVTMNRDKLDLSYCSYNELKDCVLEYGARFTNKLCWFN